jgi:hypothetical protein
LQQRACIGFQRFSRHWLVHFARPVAARQTRVRLRARLCVIQRPDRMVLYAVFADRVAGVRLYTSRCGECSGFARLERIIGPSACDLRRRRPKRMPLNAYVSICSQSGQRCAATLSRFKSASTALDSCPHSRWFEDGVDNGRNSTLLKRPACQPGVVQN